MTPGRCSKPHYTPDFNALKDAINARDARKSGAVLRRQPDLARASDALGNNALHWSVLSRQLSLIERFATPARRRAVGETQWARRLCGTVDAVRRDVREAIDSLTGRTCHG